MLLLLLLLLRMTLMAMAVVMTLAERIKSEMAPALTLVTAQAFKCARLHALWSACISQPTGETGHFNSSTEVSFCSVYIFS